jgi:uncharacterized protein (DUF58 family)
MGIPWLLFAALLVVIAQSVIFRYFGQKGITYRRSFNTKACFQGEEIELVEQIANRNVIPVPWLRLESLIHAGLKFQRQFNLDINSGSMFQNHKSLFSLLPFTRVTRRHRVVCLQRGFYRLNSASLTCGDLLGLYRHTKQLSLDVELVVYPKPAAVEEIAMPFRSWQGEQSVKRWIVDDPFMISGVREYRYGDSMNAINWKSTARSGRLQVHQRDYTADRRLMIVLNVEDHEKQWNQVSDSELIERGIAFAAGFAQMAIEQGLEAGFGTNGYLTDLPHEPVRIEPQRGSEQLTLLLDTMAKLVIARRVAFEDWLDEMAASGMSNLDVLIISAYVSDKMLHPIERIRGNGNSVEVFMLQNEQRTEDPTERAEQGAGEGA